MRIAFVDVTVTVSFGGLQTAVWALARELCDLGHEVTVYGGTGPIRPDLGGRAIEVRTFDFTPRDRALDLGTRFRKLWERRTFARRARGAVAAGRHDWIVLTKPFDFFWPGLVPGPRYAFLSGGTDFMSGDRSAVARIEVLLAPSHFNAWQVAARYKRFPAVIFNGVDTERFVPGAPPARSRASLGFADDDVIAAFAGRLVGWKGVSYAVDALAHPSLADRPVRLLVVGEGAERPVLEERARELAVLARVTFVGSVPHADIPGWYALADVGVFPSIADEAFGITIAECMSCERPVVASYIGGIPEVVGNEGRAGRLVPPADAGAIAASLRALADDAALRRALGVAARERIVTHFTWRAAAERMLAALAAAPK
jgi:glycosyltransferase involved in cell wall biosynthesis